MMDAETIVSTQQSLIQAVVGALLSDLSYDLGVAGTPPAAFQAVGSIFHDVGRGNDLQAFAQIVESVTSGGAFTCQCALVMADDAALGTNLTVLSETPAIGKATLVAGYQFRLGNVPQGISRRFLGFRYTTAVAVATAGKVMAGFLVGRSTVRVTGTDA
jgi:hypothetical protein